MDMIFKYDNNPSFNTKHRSSFKMEAFIPLNLLIFKIFWCYFENIPVMKWEICCLSNSVVLQYQLN